MVHRLECVSKRGLKVMVWDRLGRVWGCPDPPVRSRTGKTAGSVTGWKQVKPCANQIRRALVPTGRKPHDISIRVPARQETGPPGNHSCRGLVCGLYPNASTTPRGLHPRTCQSFSEFNDTSSGRAGEVVTVSRDAGRIRDGSYCNAFATSVPNSTRDNRAGPPQCHTPGSDRSESSRIADAASLTWIGVRYSSEKRGRGDLSVNALSIQPSTPRD